MGGRDPRRLIRLVAALAGVVLAVIACGGISSDAADRLLHQGDKGVVKLAVNPWVGYEANAAVITYLLEHELGYRVDERNLKEEIAWQGFETGEVDAIVENWGHDDLKTKYIEGKQVAVDAGPTGNMGVIGWYVPAWMTRRYAGITDWRNLNRYAGLFRTSESGGAGQLLDGDPSFVTHDEALVRNLGLTFKVVYSGGEAATIKVALQAARARKPLLFYFYELQWLHSRAQFARVELPRHHPGCDADPKQVACGYPLYELDKIVSRKFAQTGGAAYELVRNFRWTNADQNEVASYIADDDLLPEQAAQKWVKTHENLWRGWLAPAGPR